MHELPLHPLTITHLMLKTYDHLIAPLAETNLENVPAEFIKYFLVVASFLIGNYVMLKRSGAANGKAEDPVHLKSPIETKKSPIFADKHETSEALRAVNARLDQLERRIGDNYNDIVKAGQDRSEKLTSAIHEVKDDIIEKIDQAMKEAYSRINEQDTRLSRMEGKLSITKPGRD